MGALMGANEVRRIRAAAGQVAALLDLAEVLPATCSDRELAVVRLRLEHPAVSLGELGALAGLSKDTAAAILRRVVQRGRRYALACPVCRASAGRRCQEAGRYRKPHEARRPRRETGGAGA